MVNYYMTADEIVSSGVDTAILPIGSTEQHGPHLPIGTDFIIAEAISTAVAKKMNLFVLPPLPVSTCYEHKGKKGSIWMKPDTFYHMLQDIILCLKDQGFKRIVLLLGHGGIFIAGPVVRELNALHADLTVIKIDLLQFFNTEEMMSILESQDNLHACEYETSLMLYLKEELVHKERIDDCVPSVPRDYLNYGSLLKYSTNGVWGKPSLGSKEKGEKIFEVLVNKSIAYIDETFEFLQHVRS